MEKLKTALIGVGNWGKKLARELEKQTDLQYLVHNNNKETSDWIKENLKDIKTTNNLDEVLKDADIRALFIATPISTHFDIALKSLQAGKNVFLEKPGTETSKKLEILIDEARKRNLIFQVGYEFAYSEKIYEIKKKILDNKIKRISFIWKKWGSFNSHPVVNLLVHEISILKSIGLKNLIFTEYKEVDGDNHPDIIYAKAKSDNIDINFEINRVSTEKEKLMEIELEDEAYVWKENTENLIEKEVREFISCVKENKEPVTDGIFAKEILEITESIPYHN